MRQIKLLIAALLLISPLAANADVITVEFTALGFNPGAPTDPVSGTIVYEAAGLTATIDSLISIDLTIAGYVYSLAELLVVQPLLDDFDRITGIPNGSALAASSDDFAIIWNRVTGIAERFLYSCAACDQVYGTFEFSAFTRTVSVPEPSTIALLSLGLLGLGLSRRKKV